MRNELLDIETPSLISSQEIGWTVALNSSCLQSDPPSKPELKDFCHLCFCWTPFSFPMKEPNDLCQGLMLVPQENALLALTSANRYYKMPIEGGLMETRLDKFGRVVLPKDIRDHLDLKPGQVLKVERADEEVILKPVEKELPLHIKNGVLVFSGAVTGDITKAVKEHREGRLKKISLLK